MFNLIFQGSWILLQPYHYFIEEALPKLLIGETERFAAETSVAAISSGVNAVVYSEHEIAFLLILLQFPQKAVYGPVRSQCISIPFVVQVFIGLTLR
ncbi:hypothetical protein SLS54_003825 [Diplodia seriata]